MRPIGRRQRWFLRGPMSYSSIHSPLGIFEEFSTSCNVPYIFAYHYTSHLTSGFYLIIRQYDCKDTPINKESGHADQQTWPAPASRDP